ncbi:hypothetical protein HND92_18095 [Diaphorobacter sp. JS3050]|uniref:hypothetical protein n=1 Tax=Diaphorobacter sp. JS3050 TaxID=2735554 RepID=UPI00155601FF|nr:hypothetical protein [Diaphorobacter sp. JS3050]QJY34701.1 hypothetical protein HND92_18095 [Diaphorobacter sp. JS3050]
MDEFPGDHAEQVKEIYARFGLAIYQAQCLEHGLVNALVMLDLIPNERHKVKSRAQWEGLVDYFMDSKFELTLGKLIKSLSAVAAVPDNLAQDLASALKLRNYLAHHYFRERSEMFVSATGRRKMFDELIEWCDQLSKADDELSFVVAPAAAAAGLTPELQEKLFKELLERAQNSS